MAEVHAAEAPYVGPRPFERTVEDRARFFGRDEETQEIVSLVMGHPAVLVYAQSGAGKTSLFNARIAPELEKRGFEVLPLTRVRRVAPPGVNADSIPNLYMYCALLAWAPEAETSALAGVTLADFLAQRPRPTTSSARPAPRVIIFDQMEELFGFYPKDWRKQQDDFFAQIAAALAADPLLRAVFVIREDYLAQLDPFAPLLPEELRVRFRVERLREPDALLAVTGPLEDTGRSFAPGVAEKLVDELLLTRVLGPDGQPAEVEGQYVEPVQLQVVCLNLWNSLPAGAGEITNEQLQQFGDVDQALARFYAESLQKAVKEGGVSESALRDWFSTALITSAATRGTVFRGPNDTAGIANAAVDVLDRQHIIRREERAGAGWYELTHDRFIEPIQNANAEWNRVRMRRLISWAIAAAGVAALVIFSGLIFGGRMAVRNAAAEASATANAVAAEAAAVAAAAENQAAEAALAVSNQLAAQAEAQGQASSLDLALLLGAEALRAADTQAARQAMQNLLQSWPGVQAYLYTHEAPVGSLAFDQNGQALASGDDAGIAVVWSELEPDRAIPDRFDTMYHDTKLGAIQAVALSLEAQALAVGTGDGRIRLLRAEGPPRPLDAHTDAITGLAFSPDGRFLASASLDGKAILWPLTSPQANPDVLETRDSPITAIAFSSDGATLAIGGGEITLVNLNTAGPGRSLGDATAGGASVAALAFDPARRRLAAGFDDGAFAVWRLEDNGLAFQPVDASEFSVEAIAFDAQDESLVVIFADGSSNHYPYTDLVSGGTSPAGWTRPVAGTKSAALTADGRAWAIGLDSGAIMLGRMSGMQPLDANAGPDALIAQACRIANRNLYPAEWNLFIGEGVPYRETCFPAE